MKTCTQKTLSLPRSLILPLFLFLLLGAWAGPSRAVANRVSWEQLPYYLESRGIALKENLPLCDCPLAINQERPSHHILQVIANTFYEWQEYRFTDSRNNPRLAVYLLQPEEKPLTAEAARVLLTASASWTSENRSAIRAATSWPGADIKLQPREFTAAVTTIRTAENRLPVPPNLITSYPYNTIASLIINDGDHHYPGTGFLISPYCILTAGHNVFWVDHLMDSILAGPALHTGADGKPVLPYDARLANQSFLRTNNVFRNYTGNYFTEPTESDFGAIMLEPAFDNIATYMPLAFSSPDADLPDDLMMVAGYPLHVPAGSEELNQDMYGTKGRVSPHPGNWELIDYDFTLSDGNDGSPIFYKAEDGRAWAIGIVTTARTGVLLNTNNMELIRYWMRNEVEYKYSYYIPFYHKADNVWTGLALANPYTNTSFIQIEYFSIDGKLTGWRYEHLDPGGQKAFACNPGTEFGWIKISASSPIHGLALVGEFGAMSTMFDMDMKEKLHKILLFPHLASLQQEKWASVVMLCNPNPEPARLTFKYYDMDGDMSSPANSPPEIPAYGSVAIEAGRLFGKDLENGSLFLSSSQPLAGFLLYDNTATGTNHWKAGLSAVPLD